MEPPLLTLITVTFNAEPFLERTLQSVAAQSQRQGVEYILIDGGSGDGTLALAEKYRGLFAAVVSEPDRGLYDAMNKGLQRATGRYVWFLNAGDELFDSQTFARFFQETATLPDVYYGDALFVREDGSAVGLRSVVTPHRLPRQLGWQHFRLGMVVCHQAFVVKRALAPAYDLQHPYSADIDWEIRCLKAARQVKQSALPLCRYLTGGYSVQHLRASLLDRFAILKKHFGLLPTLLAHGQLSLRGLQFAWQKKGRYW